MTVTPAKYAANLANTTDRALLASRLEAVRWFKAAAEQAVAALPYASATAHRDQLARCDFAIEVLSARLA